MFYKDESQYKEMLPSVFDGIIEIDALHNSITVEIDKLNDCICDGVNNKSIANATEQGIERWEALLGVSAPLNATMESRRNALKSKLMTKPPINIDTLRNIIETYMGLVVDITVNDYTITVKYRGQSKIPDLAPLYENVYETIPSSMIIGILYAYLTYLEEKQKFPTYADQKGYTYRQVMRGEN